MIQFTKLMWIFKYCKYAYLVIKFDSKILVPPLETINEEIILVIKNFSDLWVCYHFWWGVFTYWMEDKGSYTKLLSVLKKALTIDRFWKFSFTLDLKTEDISAISSKFDKNLIYD